MVCVLFHQVPTLHQPYLVAKLVNTGKLKITFSIPEKYATQVKQIPISSRLPFLILLKNLLQKCMLSSSEVL
jgi:hypothetical protein